MATIQAAFSPRSQHKLNYTVNATTSGATTTFVWSFTITTSNNSNTPFGSNGSFNNTTTPGTTYVSGMTNSATSFSYDYRSPNQNRTYNASYFGGSGTRTAPAGSGDYNFTLNVSMGTLIGSASATIVMPSGSAPTPAPVWSTTSLGDFGRVGSAYSTTVSASNVNTYSIASGSLPPGLSIGSNGVISGVMSAGASEIFEFRVNAIGAGGTTQSNLFSITRFQALPVWAENTLVTNTLRVGDAYSDGVLANNATSYSASGLPAGGISLDTSTGVVSGEPTSTSSFSFTIFASNSDGNSISQGYTFSPKARLATWIDNTISTPTIKKGQSYSDGVSANNAVSYAVQSGALPTGVVLAPSTGVISGTPTTVGLYTFTLSATNASSESIFTGSLTINVEAAGGGSVWNGSAWTAAGFKVWNGSTWVDAPVKVWNGSVWTDPIS
jgi:hypothetical protein